ncbi:MAG: hypothetical protein JSS04_28755 [Proteobacteria bacterium]|nr:hypothetical protein [Pseudomonadota bacterium]
MGEQRDGATSAARQGLRFYARCAGEAWRRSWDAANAIAPVLGLLVLYGGARLGGLDLSFSVPGAGGSGALIGTGLFIALAWAVVFLVQLVATPPRLHARLEAELLALARRRAPPTGRLTALPEPKPVAALSAPVQEEATVLLPPTPPSRVTAPPPPKTGEGVLPSAAREHDPIHVRLHDQVYETAAVDTTGARLPAARAYVARVANRGDRRVRRCQLFFCNPAHIQVVSGPFDLAPGEHRDLPVLRVIDEAEEPHALLYFLDGETWAVADGQAAWLPEPGCFKVKVLSADAPDAALDVTLACSTGTPLAWTLVEAADADRERTAPKAGRRRAARAAADVVAEPSAGD